MKWSSPFIIYRIVDGRILEPVHRPEDIKSAKYWLTHIALIGDVLCRTPAHPKHSGESAAPDYWSHKAASGITVSSFESWKKDFAKQQIDFPHEDCPIQERTL